MTARPRLKTRQEMAEKTSEPVFVLYLPQRTHQNDRFLPYEPYWTPWQSEYKPLPTKTPEEERADADRSYIRSFLDYVSRCIRAERSPHPPNS